MLNECKIYACANGTLGLHLSRAPWDPYPWVSGIQEGSSAQNAGMRVGDTVLELNGCDVLGQKILEIATRIREHWQSGANYVTVVIWRNDTDAADNSCSDDEDDDVGGVCDEADKNARLQQHQQQQQPKEKQQQQKQHSSNSINQQSLQKFATCLQHIAQLLECPVCLEVIKPPGWQCCNGHVLCNNCRSRSVKCPVCRVPLGPRGRCLLSDKLFTVLAESFPCDGVKSSSNSNSNKTNEKRKCSPEFKSRAKLDNKTAAAQPQEIKAKEIRKKVKSCVEQRQQEADKTAKECDAAVANTATTEVNNVESNKTTSDEGRGGDAGGGGNVAGGAGGVVGGAGNTRTLQSFQWLRGSRARRGDERQLKTSTNEQLSNCNNNNNHHNNNNNIDNSTNNNNNNADITIMTQTSPDSNLCHAECGDAAGAVAAANAVGDVTEAATAASTTTTTASSNNVLVKLKLKSSKKSADCTICALVPDGVMPVTTKPKLGTCRADAFPCRVHGQSHELLSGNSSNSNNDNTNNNFQVTIVNNGLTARVLQLQQLQQQT